MERIEIPGDATYSPIALTDILIAAPFASRLILGATLPGRVLQAAALGYYAGSSAKDWVARSNVRRIDFTEAFGADVFRPDEMSREDRGVEVARLGEALNDGYDPTTIPRAELATEVNRHLTSYVASITGQVVDSSSEVRSFNLAMLVFPFAYGACDILSGDVAIFKDTGIFEPHLIAHEFSHRKGYFKELHAQALAYLALRNSGDSLLVQAARAERLHRQAQALSGDDPKQYEGHLQGARLRTELQEAFRFLRPAPGAYASLATRMVKRLYDERLRLTGQNGLSDYDVGFTNFLYTYSRSPTASQPVEHARV